MKTRNVVVRRVKGGLVVAGASMVSGLVSVSAFAQASGTSATPAFNDSAILASVNGVVPILVDVGGAVLAVVVVAWGYKAVKGFLGR